MLVIFDTNIWKSDLYLRSSTASAVKFYLNLKCAKIGLPEVVEMEVKNHLLTDLKTYRDRVRRDHNQLLALFRQLKEVILPTDEEIERLVDEYFDGIGLPLERIKFSMKAARASFLRTIKKQRPSHKTQQFKDGVLWEDCKSLAKQSPVVLVSGDRAFFEDDNVKRGLARELAHEIESEGLNLKILPTLAELLSEIRRPVQVPVDILKADLESQLGEQFDRLVERNGFSRDKDGELNVRYYATEDSSVLFVEACGEYPCEDVSGSNRSLAILKFACDGSFSIRGNNFDGLSLTELELCYLSEDGQEESKRSVFLRTAGIGIGTRTIEHQVRHLLDE